MWIYMETSRSLHVLGLLAGRHSRGSTRAEAFEAEQQARKGQVADGQTDGRTLQANRIFEIFWHATFL